MQQPASSPSTRHALEPALRGLLAETLGIASSRVDAFTDDTPLFGALPEMDSMAVANVLTAMEEQFGVVIEDDDVQAEDFATYGSLRDFAQRLTRR